MNGERRRRSSLLLGPSVVSCVFLFRIPLCALTSLWFHSLSLERFYICILLLHHAYTTRAARGAANFNVRSRLTLADLLQMKTNCSREKESERCVFRPLMWWKRLAKGKNSAESSAQPSFRGQLILLRWVCLECWHKSSETLSAILKSPTLTWSVIMQGDFHEKEYFNGGYVRLVSGGEFTNLQLR